MKPFWKKADRDLAKRKAIARKSLAEIQQLALARYPLAMLFDKVNTMVERGAGESWPVAYAKAIGLDLTQFRDFCQGTIDAGRYSTTSEAAPTERELRNYFRGWAAVLIETEKELALGKH